MKLTIPNILTLGRVIGIPIMFLFFCLSRYSGWEWAQQAAALVYAVAAITDWFDGYLARKLNQSSKFGAFLDPVADKLLVAVALVVIVMDQPNLYVTLAASVIIGREIVISALREWLAEMGERTAVAVSSIGKIKTGFQMTALGLLLWREDIFFLPTNNVGLVLLGLAAVLTLYSMILYLRAAWPYIQDEQG
jgi:CDP-diacylglycerol--glycerol-3-phosphate 3-phosphatidyltransferase/cardiolipin synthase